MDSSHLTIEQLEALFEKPAEISRYLNKVHEWMHRQTWRRDDELDILAKQAANAAHRLAMAVRYAACDEVLKRPK